MHDELPPLQRGTQLAFELPAIAHADIYRFGKHLPTAAPLLTRNIHCRRRLLHQAFQALYRRAKTGNADADRNVEPLIADRERLFLLGNQAAGDPCSGIGAAIGQEQGEFVAPQAGQQISRADEVAQSFADRAQRPIADCLPQSLVDPSEVVDIDAQQADTVRARRPASSRRWPSSRNSERLGSPVSASCRDRCRRLLSAANRAISRWRAASRCAVTSRKIPCTISPPPICTACRITSSRSVLPSACWNCQSKRSTPDSMTFRLPSAKTCADGRLSAWVDGAKACRGRPIACSRESMPNSRSAASLQSSSPSASRKTMASPASSQTAMSFFSLELCLAVAHVPSFVRTRFVTHTVCRQALRID